MFLNYYKVDTEHNCGYVTLIKLKKSKDQVAVEKVEKDSDPKNGKMIPENADLVTYLPLNSPQSTLNQYLKMKRVEFCQSYVSDGSSNSSNS